MVDPAPRDERIEQIRRAAVDVFGQLGFRGASMAAIADAVGISRPALYQYFENREDLFRATMELLLEESADAALAALDETDDLVTALTGWLYHGFLDGYERLATLEHAAELLEAHHEFSEDVAARASARMRAGLVSYLKTHPAVTTGTRSAIELLQLAPMGLKADGPTPAVYGRRLAELATAVAAMLRSEQPARPG